MKFWNIWNLKIYILKKAIIYNFILNFAFILLQLNF